MLCEEWAKWDLAGLGERCNGNGSGVGKGGKLMAGSPREGSSAKFEEDGTYEGDIQIECVVSK